MLDNMTSSLQNALCCWSSSQQSPVDDRPSSPSSPESPCSAHSLECTCHRPTSEKKAATSTSPSHCCYHQRQAQAQRYSSQQQQQQQQHLATGSSKVSTILITPPSSAASSPSTKRTWPRTSHIKGVVAKKNNKNSAPSAHDVVSPYHSTTFMLTPPSAYHYDGYSYNHHHRTSPASTTPGKSPSKRVSLQKYYYGRNTMTAARAAAFASSPSSRTPSPPPSSSSPSSSSPSSPTTRSTHRTLGSEFILGSSPSLVSTTQPLSLSSAVMDTDMALTSNPGRPGTQFLSSSKTSLSTPSLLSLPSSTTTTSTLQGSNAGSSIFGNNTISSRQPLSLTILPTLTTSDQDQDMPSSQRRLSPPTLTTILATPVSPCPPSFPSSSASTLSPLSMTLISTSPTTPYSPSSAFSCSPSSSMTSFSSSPPSTSFIDSSNYEISSPDMTDATPFPASAMSAAKLANLLQQADQATAGASAGLLSHRRPLILDLRPHPDFYPISISKSININLPTLLMRRYRRGGAISTFALESFITIPSDKDLYHQILDSWRGKEEDLHDIVVLDQDMSAGPEEYGRSATAAWTLLNVLERGGGQGCFGGAPIRVWYLEGGFEAFHSWDAGEKFLVRPGLLSATMTVSPSSSPNMGPVTTQSNDQDVEMTMARDQNEEKTVSRKPSLLAINTSVAFVPKHRTPARRESLFSLNTKSLQRPSGLNRSQTVNLKPLIIPTINTQLPQRPQQQQQQPNKGVSWLAVPSNPSSSTTGPALSPAMSVVSNHSMEIAHSASTDHTSSSCWSADSSSINGSGQFPLTTTVPAGGMVSMLSLSSKPSVSSLRTLISSTTSSACIREEDEDEFRHQSYNHFNNNSSNQISQDFHQEYNNRMFKNAISTEQYPSPPQQYQEQQQFNDSHQFQSYPAGRMGHTMSTYSSSDSLHSQHHHHHHHHLHQDDEENSDDGEQEISCILPGFLYLGPEIVNADQVQTLERLGVKRILNMATECEDLLVSSQQAQFQYHKIGVYDQVDADVSAGLLQAVDIIAACRDSPIYVHCKAGKSRSVTATIAYLITRLHWPLNKAYQHVLTQRPCMCPNIGFVTELMRMEEKTLGADKAGGLHVRS